MMLKKVSLSNITKFFKFPSFQINKITIPVPEKFKGRVVENWIKYWELLINDYIDVFHSTVEQCKLKPYKATAYVGTGVLFVVAAHNNPTVQDYRDRVVHYQNLFGLVGKPIRNPGVDVYLKSLESSFNYGLIRRLSFCAFSLMWVDNYDEALGLYKAQCSYLKPRYVTFYERIIDIGFFNQFWILEKNMRDYDVNPNEWIDFSHSEYKYKNNIM